MAEYDNDGNLVCWLLGGFGHNILNSPDNTTSYYYLKDHQAFILQLNSSKSCKPASLLDSCLLTVQDEFKQKITSHA